MQVERISHTKWNFILQNLWKILKESYFLIVLSNDFYILKSNCIPIAVDIIDGLNLHKCEWQTQMP